MFHVRGIIPCVPEDPETEMGREVTVENIRAIKYNVGEDCQGGLYTDKMEDPWEDGYGSICIKRFSLDPIFLFQ